MSRYPNPPGHPQSVADGCLCAVHDNCHGAGCGYVDAGGNPLYYFNLDCPLHGGDKAEPMDPDEPCFDAAHKDAHEAAWRAGQA